MIIKLSLLVPFNLDLTLCCGQAFRWSKKGEWWYSIVNDKPFKIRQIADILEFENVDESFVKRYFGLNDDLSRIFQTIARDKHIKTAINKFSGLRILRQNPWECLISYICATYKNISAIQQMIYNISKKFGNKTYFDKCEFYTFPTSETLAKATVNALRDCGLGYRAKYVSETAKVVYKNDFDLERLKKMPYEKARKELLSLFGVGLKVADCVSLFGLEKLEAFPVDVWIKRAITNHYANHFPQEFINKILPCKSLSPTEYNRVNLFGREYFGEYAGYAQEYLYHYERTREA